MNTKGALLLAACAGLLCACDEQATSAPALPESISVVMQNPLAQANDQTPVYLQRAALIKHFQAQQQQWPALYINDTVQPCQVNDEDRDGLWDSLACLVNLAPSASVEGQIRWHTADDYPQFPTRTNIRFAERVDGQYLEMQQERRPSDYRSDNRSKHYQMEGPGWENDNIGFRHYFDERNGWDVFGKLRAQMVLDHAGIDEDYHQLQSWGMDVLKVGNSLGAGGFALSDGEQVYRLRDTQEKFFQIHAEGPVFSSFSLQYQGWQVADRMLNVRQRVQIWAGTQCYTSLVELDGALDGLELLLGVANFNDTEAIWQATPGKLPMLVSHANQDEQKKPLGMALILESPITKKPEQLQQQANATLSDVVAIKLQKDAAIRWHFCAGWGTRHSQFNTAESFTEAVADFAKTIQNPPQLFFPSGAPQ